MKARSKAITVLVGVTCVIGGVASSASAAGGNASPAISTPPPRICVDGDGGLCLYYLGSGAGARAEATGNVLCYDNCSGQYQYTFWDTTDGTAGKGDIVRNATHSVFNNNVTYGYYVFVSPNYSGPSEAFCPENVDCIVPGGMEWTYQFAGDLDKELVNNDASQEMFLPAATMD